jgi:hypothetical protein
MTPTNTLTVIMIAALAMLFLEILLTIWLGYYVANMNTKMAADDAALFLQGRRVQDVLTEMRSLLKEAR